MKTGPVGAELFHADGQTYMTEISVPFRNFANAPKTAKIFVLGRLVGQARIKMYTPVHALSFCTGRTAHRGSRGIALLFLDHSTGRGWEASVTPQPLFTPGKDPVPIVQESGWAPGPVWTGAENLASTGIRSPDRPAHSQSLYRLSYAGPHKRGLTMWNVQVSLRDAVS